MNAELPDVDLPLSQPNEAQTRFVGESALFGTIVPGRSVCVC